MNKDCLRLIFSNLDVSNLYTIREVSTTFNKIAENMIGISSTRPRINQLNDEIMACARTLAEKRKEMNRLYLEQSNSLMNCPVWQRQRLTKIINCYNCIYGATEGRADPEFVLEGLVNPRLFTIYNHCADCLSPNPFVGDHCNCPLSFMQFTFYHTTGYDEDEEQRLVPFASSYDITRQTPFDGFFDDIMVSTFNGRRTMTGGWSTVHVVEQILYRYLVFNIQFRRQRSKEIVRENVDVDDNYSYYDVFRNYGSKPPSTPTIRRAEGPIGEEDNVIMREDGSAWLRLPPNMLQQIMREEMGRPMEEERPEEGIRDFSEEESGELNED